MWGVSLTHPMLTFFFFFREFHLHTPCWLHFYLGSYMPHARLTFLWGVSLTHPMLSFFMWEVSPTHPMLTSFLSKGVSLTRPVLSSFLFFVFCLFLSGEFLLDIPCWLHFYIGSFSYTSHDSYLKIIFGSFSYTSRAGFIFIWVVPLKHPVRPSFLCGEFLLHIPCCLFFSFLFLFLGSFSYTFIPCRLHFHLGRSS